MLHARADVVMGQLKHRLEAFPVAGACQVVGEVRVMVLTPVLAHRVVHIRSVQLVLERQSPFLHTSHSTIQHLERRLLDDSTLEPQQLRQLGRCHRPARDRERSEEHTSELQSRENLVCRLLLEKKKKKYLPYLNVYRKQ